MNEETIFGNRKNDHPYSQRATSSHNRMPREAINELPLTKYDGSISFIQTEEELAQIIGTLKGQTILGFDIEIRPAFKKGQSYPPSLLQLATSHTVYILQLQKTGLSQHLLQILEEPNIIKTGVSTQFDVIKLQEIVSFTPQGFVDLAHPAKKAGLHNFGLRGLAAVLLGIRIPKGAQRTNWAKDDLTDGQIRYAATDAWVGREIYLKMVQKGMIDIT